MEAHGADLRAQGAGEAVVEALKGGGRPPGEADRALVDYAVKLTREPWAMTRDDADSLRARGFSDEAIVDAAEAASFFNYINRVADALGVDPEPDARTRAFPADKG